MERQLRLLKKKKNKKISFEGIAPQLPPNIIKPRKKRSKKKKYIPPALPVNISRDPLVEPDLVRISRKPLVQKDLLDKLTVKELRKMAKKIGLRGYSKLRKKDLLNKIKNQIRSNLDKKKKVYKIKEDSDKIIKRIENRLKKLQTKSKLIFPDKIKID